MHMDFKPLPTMKKSFPFCKTQDGKRTILFDISALSESKLDLTEEEKEKITEQVIKSSVGMTTYDAETVCIKIDRPEIKVYMDLTFKIHHVSKRETGKQLYTLKTLDGFTSHTYEKNIYGIVPESAFSKGVDVYGTLKEIRRYSIYRHDSEDVEI
jgi:hypothetical protein